MARFIIAPNGYGKTYLALEYAEIVHSWSHVFWFNAQSPCFVRDLDEESLAMSCLDFDPSASLVVLDDAPLLDATRQRKLSFEIDKLLARGCEVVVTCQPTCNLDSSLQRDRLCLRANALLLDDMDLDAARTLDERTRVPAEEMGPALRVPLLVWSSSSDAASQFVKESLSEEMPSDMLLALSSMLVLGEGAIRDLASFGPIGGSVLEGVSDDYPHLGIDSDLERFEASPIEVNALATPVKRILPRLAARSAFDTADDLVEAWASVLLRQGRAQRACAVIEEICPRRSRAKWLTGNAVDLVRAGCFFPSLRLALSKGEGKGELRMRQDAFEALCRRMLGDEEGAVRCAKRNAFNESAPEDVRVLSLIVAARAGAGAIAYRAGEVLSDEMGIADLDALSSCSNWVLLTEVWRVSTHGLPDLASLWSRMLEAGVAEGVLCICASWLFRLYDGRGEELRVETLLALQQAERFVRERLMCSVGGAGMDYFVASAGLSLEEAHGRGMPLEGGSLEATSLIMLRHVEMNILAQRRLFDEDMRMKQARRHDWIATHPGSLFNREAVSPSVDRSIPVLSVRLFGCFEVSIGGVPVEYSQFKRQNTRTLLTVLAVNQGREISRDSLCQAMWPRSSSVVAHKNFYTVWSQLRAALSLPDGTCPYLVRHQYGCSLDTRFLQSDIDRLNEICRELLFSVPNIEHWSLLFAEIDRDFTSDLMPNENKNALVVQARDDCRSRLVDALVAATISVIDIDSPQWGVWFARAAIARDATREDAYVALMRAQIAGSQRTAAMMTYLNCRHALSKHLGIDPSPETTALYESLLDGD